MKKTNIIKSFMAALTCMVMFSACYKDKGNYDYWDIDVIEISGIEAEYSISIGEGVSIEPTITHTIPGGEDDFSYAWYRLEGKILLNTSKNLEDWVPSLSTGLHKLYYGVTDKRTGVEYYSSVFSLKINNDIRSGIFFMSELDNGSGQVVLLNCVDGEFFPRIVSPAGMPDYGKPVGIWTYPDNMAPAVDGNAANQRFSICIIGEDGGYRLNPIDLSYDPRYSLENMFLYNEPEGFYTKRIYTLKKKYTGIAYLRTNTDDIMCYSRGNSMMWTHGIYINSWSDNSRFNVADDMVSCGFGGNFIMFNTDTKSFVWVPLGATYAETFAPSLEDKFKFNNTGSDLLFMTGRPKEGNVTFVIYALLKNGNTYTLVNFDEDGEQIAKFDISGATEIGNAVGYEMTINNTNNEFFYYRTDKDIYYYNMTNGQSKKVYSAPAGNVITLMQVNNFYENRYYTTTYNGALMIATYDASKGDAGGTFELYKITPLTGELVLDTHGDNKPARWTGYGKIISSDHKSM